MESSEYRRRTWTGVYATQYRPDVHSANSIDAIRDCFALNTSFYGWRHQFLYNIATLTAVLHSTGFARIQRRSYGQSTNPDLCDLEQHQPAPDSPDLPHVLIVEASGTATNDDTGIIEASSQFLAALHGR